MVISVEGERLNTTVASIEYLGGEPNPGVAFEAQLHGNVGVNGTRHCKHRMNDNFASIPSVQHIMFERTADRGHVVVFLRTRERVCELVPKERGNHIVVAVTNRTPGGGRPVNIALVGEQPLNNELTEPCRRHVGVPVLARITRGK